MALLDCSYSVMGLYMMEIAGIYTWKYRSEEQSTGTRGNGGVNNSRYRTIAQPYDVVAPTMMKERLEFSPNFLLDTVYTFASC